MDDFNAAPIMLQHPSSLGGNDKIYDQVWERENNGNKFWGVVQAMCANMEGRLVDRILDF